MQCRPPAHPKARIGMFPQAAHILLGYQGEVGLPARAIDTELWTGAGLVDLPVRHTPLVGRVDCYTRSGRPKEVSPEDLCLFWHPGSPMWGPPKLGLHHAPCTQVPYKGYVSPQWPILPRHLVEAPTIDPGLCLGAAILVGYASLPAPGGLHPLAMSVVELKWHMGRYLIFSKQDVLKGLGSAIPEAKAWDMGIPQVDSAALPTMTGVTDTWLSPMKTQWVNDNIFPSSGY